MAPLSRCCRGASPRSRRRLVPATEPAYSTGSALGYWVLVVALVAMGYLTAFSIGALFWFIAFALIVMSPFRSRPRIYRSGMALFVGFLIGYVLIAPWGCSQSFAADLTTGEETLSPIVCTSLVGVEYSGPEPFDPSPLPALIAGGASAVVASTSIWLVGSPRDDDSTGQGG